MFIHLGLKVFAPLRSRGVACSWGHDPEGRSGSLKVPHIISLSGPWFCQWDAVHSASKGDHVFYSYCALYLQHFDVCWSIRWIHPCRSRAYDDSLGMGSSRDTAWRVTNMFQTWTQSICVNTLNTKLYVLVFHISSCICHILWSVWMGTRLVWCHGWEMIFVHG